MECAWRRKISTHPILSAEAPAARFRFRALSGLPHAALCAVDSGAHPHVAPRCLSARADDPLPQGSALSLMPRSVSQIDRIARKVTSQRMIRSTGLELEPRLGHFHQPATAYGIVANTLYL